jgi:hypothetical protein
LISAVNISVSMEVGVPNVPGRVNDGPEYFVLKPLDDSNVAWCCAPPHLNAIGPYWIMGKCVRNM